VQTNATQPLNLFRFSVYVVDANTVLLVGMDSTALYLAGRFACAVRGPGRPRDSSSDRATSRFVADLLPLFIGIVLLSLAATEISQRLGILFWKRGSQTHLPKQKTGRKRPPLCRKTPRVLLLYVLLEIRRATKLHRSLYTYPFLRRLVKREVHYVLRRGSTLQAPHKAFLPGTSRHNAARLPRSRVLVRAAVRQGSGDIALVGGIILLLAGEEALEVFGRFLYVRCLRPPFGRRSSPALPFVSSRIERSRRNSICLFSECSRWAR
jgi:hypothetical protein